MAEREVSTCSNEKTLSDENHNVPNEDKSETASQAQDHDQPMPQSFSMMSGLGMAFSITNTWIAYLSLLGQNLLYGGPQSVILGLLVAAIVQWTLTLGLSELASAFHIPVAIPLRVYSGA
ncbi:hypothetical protein B0O99DRAFT_682791 [Bisporella sp. PMI_857]|nr:hypothetical protein B0O99DRAFT_682791 [Bisporella sp. PMI_857]